MSEEIKCEMPALTDAQRSQAIRDFTVRAVNTDCDVSALAYQIALAALTAKPYLWLGTISGNSYMEKDGNDSRIPLFDAPPVASLKPIELPAEIDGSMIARVHLDETASDKVEAYVIGANWRLSQIKRLNGLK